MSDSSKGLQGWISSRMKSRDELNAVHEKWTKSVEASAKQTVANVSNQKVSKYWKSPGYSSRYDCVGNYGVVERSKEVAEIMKEL